MAAAKPPALSPRGRIKATLGCTEDEAETVRKVLAGVMEHRMTRAFLVMSLHMSTTTRVPGGSRDDFLINEGKRQVGMFLAACAQTGLDLDLYGQPGPQPEPETPAVFRPGYRNPAGDDE